MFRFVIIHLRVLFKDIKYHLVYTIFLLFASFLLTYIFIPQITKTQKQLATTTETIVTSALPPSEVQYVERGSPLDNRAYNGKLSPDVIFHGSRDKKVVALTFDAEMTDFMKTQVLTGKVKSSYDKRIIDTLRKTNTKATFFLTGMWIELYPNETKDFGRDPLFEIGSHSFSDSSYFGYCYGLKQLPKTVAVEEIGATEKLIRENAGIDNRLFRFPGGCYSQEDVDLVKKANDVVVHWDVSGADGFNNDANQIVRNVVENVQNGSIIVLHMNGEPTAPKTADALPMIISALKAKGFEFVKVNELLGLPQEPRGGI